MKKMLALMLLFALFAGLSACSPLVKDDYSVVTPYIELPLSDKLTPQKDTTTVVSNRTELRGAVLSFIREWKEQGSILVRDYEGNVSEDLKETVL